MADELADNYANLTLNSEETDVVDVGDIDHPEQDSRVSLTLVGKLYTDRPGQEDNNNLGMLEGTRRQEVGIVEGMCEEILGDKSRVREEKTVEEGLTEGGSVHINTMCAVGARDFAPISEGGVSGLGQTNKEESVSLGRGNVINSVEWRDPVGQEILHSNSSADDTDSLPLSFALGIHHNKDPTKCAKGGERRVKVRCTRGEGGARGNLPNVEGSSLEGEWRQDKRKFLEDMEVDGQDVEEEFMAKKRSKFDYSQDTQYLAYEVAELEREAECRFPYGNKIDARRLEGIRNKCGFSDGLCISSVGLSGGLGFWWRDVNANVVSFFSNHIVVDLLDCNNVVSWRAVGIYGWLERENKHKTWALIKDIHQNTSCLILYFGDFNEVLFENEKCGGNARSERCMNDFREVLDHTGTRDLGYTGNAFTWQRGNSDPTIIRERLDRFIACDRWCELFPHRVVQHFPIYLSRSDHAPILLHVGERVEKRRRQRIFWFETHLLSRPECEEIVKGAWESNVGDQAHIKLATCIGELKKWASCTFGSIKKKISQVEEKLRVAQQGVMDGVVINQCKSLSTELDELLLMEESYWFSRARATEFRDGDKNTPYFHHKATARKAKTPLWA
uniref:Uncharacterized protein n=1 Tax=Chenopodium quinoa TaxID=63459 RepID=A0A803ML38_CHEQI